MSPSPPPAVTRSLIELAGLRRPSKNSLDFFTQIFKYLNKQYFPSFFGNVTITLWPIPIKVLKSWLRLMDLFRKGTTLRLKSKLHQSYHIRTQLGHSSSVKFCRKGAQVLNPKVSQILDSLVHEVIHSFWNTQIYRTYLQYSYQL